METFGCVIGAAYADALGKATEFLTKYQIYKFYGDSTKIQLGIVHNDEHRNIWDPFDWTDDTDQSILVFRSIVENPENVAGLFAEKLENWFYHGFPELGDIGGCGVGTPVRWVVTYENFVKDHMNASYNVWKCTDGVLCEDGAIMRSWIIGCFDFPKEKIIDLAISICQVTHYDPRCVASCIFITICVNSFLYHSKDIAKVMEEAQEAGLRFIATAEQLSDPELAYTREVYAEKFKKYLRRGDCEFLTEVPLNRGHSRSSTKNPLACAVYAMKNMHMGYDTIIQHIIAQGGDADTNACVAGAVIGAYIGIDGIPSDYVKLKHLDWLKMQLM